jgi:hypothetical protein
VEEVERGWLSEVYRVLAVTDTETIIVSAANDVVWRKECVVVDV